MPLEDPMPVQGPCPVDSKFVDKIYEEVLNVLKTNKILLGNPSLPVWSKERCKRYADLKLAIHNLVELDNWESF